MNWQPIETAPNDGTWIAVKSVENDIHHQPSVACFCDGLWMELHHYLKGEVDYDQWPVTHWMPLPLPPTDQPAPVFESVTCVHLTDEMRRSCPQCNPGVGTPHELQPAPEDRRPDRKEVERLWQEYCDASLSIGELPGGVEEFDIDEMNNRAHDLYEYAKNATATDQPTPQQARTLARNQPCGCIVCHCEDDEQCQGCGAKSCGNHPVGEIPNPVYEQPQQADVQGANFLKRVAAHLALNAHIKDAKGNTQVAHNVGVDTAIAEILKLSRGETALRALAGEG
ncbi:hypothetical protein [uncultured Ruegeria sp.]|uniref:hypothetical protein n=1 Tax=uncultured Ruegeria sp. TaxID=259304 RepID=UPI00262596EE|nr:hypothetical protein [uncultured Ruegeria sp.]